ncbi:MAG TPA: sulfotransferase domain-containing protein [Caulobacteraceae bacterium]|nr:sulfotransferase domain-containing protein [Caulobacteraceae bacterium]
MTAMLRAPTREYRTVIMDWRRWDNFTAREDDIIVTTFPKCGTTWTQRIVDLLIFQSPDPRPIMETAPWLDATIFGPIEDMRAGLEAQTHRRSIKSHLPFDAMPVFEGVKYIHVARDGRDACMSMHNHMQGMKPEAMVRAAMAAAADPRMPRGGPPVIPEDPRDWCLGWLDRAEAQVTEGYGVDLPFFEYENTYWRERRQPYLLMVHYNDLKADLEGEMSRISDFLGIATPKSLMGELAEAARFETMKAQGAQILPHIGEMFDHGPERFLNKGVNGRWKDVMGADDLARYDALVKSKFTPSEAAWIEHGRLGAGDPRDAPD